MNNMEINNEIKAKVLYPYTLGKTKWKLLQETYYDESDPKENMGHGIKKKGFVFEVEPFYKTKNAFRYGNNYNNWFEKLINVALPILKPLSAITNEDMIWVYDTCHNLHGQRKLKPEWVKENSMALKDMKKQINNGYAHYTGGWLCDASVFQYLLSKGYDLPQFLLGYKTLHESGLAVYK